ncbi:cation efflux system protein [Cellvibrio zantedeschiae]|uniref:Cation efflux system protein n=1 Tax=Cellvibrio zantedeschiae TaxID=1237077 RepID=A0ABQ3B4E3_9GAMM|nr:efflux RND transporter periplasmic adaptor subunit [Cellvibrio zantedeschiae]GGY79306.1 cation efflux system protein [Cellvibrio zantedeschiae]
MKLFLETITKKLSVKSVLQLSLVIIAMIGIAVANAAKEESKTPPATQQKAHGDEEHEEHEEKSASLSDAQLKTAAIELAKVGPASIHETLAFYGTVEANGEKVQRVGARFVGTVRSVNKKVGDSVREGETLATIESNESLKTYSITSALNGVVAERNINVGEQTNDKTAFVIVDLSTVWIDVAVFPRDAGKIHVGQAVRIGNPANDVTGEGEIVSVAALGTSGNQSLSARVLLNNAERQWTPGLFVNADVMMAKKSVALAIRNEALQDHEGKQVVFVKEKEGFEPRPVKLGRTDGEFTEVLAGVKAGETYASKNSFIIKAELGKDGAEHE